MEIPCKIEMLGSCTAIIAWDCMERGYDFDVQLSRILYYAMLMDTEKRVPHKMTETDVKFMDALQKKAEVISDDALYEAIMKHLCYDDYVLKKKWNGSVPERKRYDYNEAFILSL